MLGWFEANNGAVIGISSLVLTVITAFYAYFTWRLLKENQEMGLAVTRALRQDRLNRMFGSLNFSSQLAFSNPDVAYAVHGLDKSIPHEEVRNLVYFSVLIDICHAYWSEEFDKNFAKAGKEYRERTSYINQILRVPDNLKRWETIKPLGYGGLDIEFVNAIDELLRHEQVRSTPRHNPAAPADQKAPLFGR
jgi:hypothetical protein